MDFGYDLSQLNRSYAKPLKLFVEYVELWYQRKRLNVFFGEHLGVSPYNREIELLMSVELGNTLLQSATVCVLKQRVSP
ncbi:hypothetical protein V1478_016675 [Vespula squamosa]|uniref:Maturase K n=1 Tax=Vespula squamosa TaxID=30214 RepID=A0ABD2A0J7_VESSQ